ncbi:unnamed protein product [Penicillium salamii]|uniref:glutathione-specific gamma-glutamylcyclotransferase n=1 Tax=Penicillium salamii TaxID=1612424 RepID=A0A9W4NP64_9EURO|nr:unnamed protein product [Penicillium salamii]
MAAAQGHLVHPEGRTWKTHFPKGDLWVFGYGSLIWKPPPHFDQRIPGYVSGYVRRFWQASSDHRGTHEKPGRVVTVIERSFWETLDDPHAQAESDSASTGKVWGAAYHIPASHAEEVHDYLDEREINGYTAHYTPFHATVDIAGDQTPIICMVYIGQPSNSQFLREAESRDPQQVAQVIASSQGASGKNTEYLFMLEKALEGIGLGTADVHVTDLVKRVKAIEAEGLGEIEEKKAELYVTKSLEGAAKDPAHANGRASIE